MPPVTAAALLAKTRGSVSRWHWARGALVSPIASSAVRQALLDRVATLLWGSLVAFVTRKKVHAAACGWEFWVELRQPPACARVGWATAMLLLPQLALLIQLVLHCALLLRYRADAHAMALLLTVCLAPLTAAAVFVSGFRFALGLCCCSPLFCPVVFPDGARPETDACNLLFSNCLLVLVRKAVHFCSTTGMIIPMTSGILAALSNASQHQAGAELTRRFLAKTMHHE